MKYPYLSLFFILSLAIEVASVRAELQLSCHIDQITDTASDVRAIRPLSINANGTRIAFISNGNFTGLNNARNFVPFLFDTRNGFGQIGLISQAPLGQLLTTYVSMDAAGTRIAFVTAGNFVRGSLFLDDLSQGTTIPIALPRSADSPFGIQQPSISANGTRIAFVSDDDLETGGNADHNREIFEYHIPTGGFIQITNTPRISRNVLENSQPSISSTEDATSIAFVSHSNITGQNPEGTAQIFLYVQTSSISVTQITTPSASTIVSSPSISADGTRIAYQSYGPLFKGIALYDIHLGRVISMIKNPNRLSFSINPSINADGTLIAYENESFGFAPSTIRIADDSGEIKVVTPESGPNESFLPSISGDGTRIAFISTGDLTGHNADHNREIFLATCLD